MQKKTEVRPELAWFVGEMEARMAAKDEEKPGWEDESTAYFLDQIDNHFGKLCTKTFNNKGVVEKSADVANFAMMLAFVWSKMNELNCIKKDLKEIDPELKRLQDLEQAVKKYLAYCGPCEGSSQKAYCDWDGCPYCGMSRIFHGDE
jgi:hypothetical protein